MGDLAAKIGDLSVKVGKFIALYEKAKQENSRIKDELDALKKQCTEQSATINRLNDRYKILQIARSVPHEEKDNHNAKQKINNLIKEVDKCLALLHV